MKLFLAAFVAMLVASFAGAGPTTDNPGDRAAKYQQEPLSRQEVFDDIKVDHPMPLGQFIAMLREQDPQVQIVLAGNPQGLDQLMVPPLHLRNVAMEQVTMLLHQFIPTLQVTGIAGQGSTVYLLSLPENTPGGHAGQQLQVFGLRDVVERLALLKINDPAKIDNAVRNSALDDVLSLVKATVSAAQTGGPATVVQVHPETLTLLVKGDNSQLDAVHAALETLKQSGVRDALAEERQRHHDDSIQLGEEINRLQARVQSDKMQQEDLRQKLLQRDEEVAQLKARLEMLQAKPDHAGKE